MQRNCSGKNSAANWLSRGLTAESRERRTQKTGDQLDDAALLQISDLARRQAEPAAIDLGIVLTELGARCRRHFVGAVKAQRRGRDDDMPDLVVLDAFEHSALVHMRIVHDLADI